MTVRDLMYMLLAMPMDADVNLVTDCRQYELYSRGTFSVYTTSGIKTTNTYWNELKNVVEIHGYYMIGDAVNKH